MYEPIGYHLGEFTLCPECIPDDEDCQTDYSMDPPFAIDYFAESDHPMWCDCCLYYIDAPLTVIGVSLLVRNHLAVLARLVHQGHGDRAFEAPYFGPNTPAGEDLLTIRDRLNDVKDILRWYDVRESLKATRRAGCESLSWSATKREMTRDELLSLLSRYRKALAATTEALACEIPGNCPDFGEGYPDICLEFCDDHCKAGYVFHTHWQGREA